MDPTYLNKKKNVEIKTSLFVASWKLHLNTWGIQELKDTRGSL